MAAQTEEQAQSEVEKIARDYGHVGDEWWAKLPSDDVREYFKTRISIKDETIAASISTLAFTTSSTQPETS
jgi:hypothetical protein